MKITLFSLLICVVGISCQTNPCKMTADEFEMKGSYLGKVHVSKQKSCSVYITIEGVFSKSSIVEYHTLYPINLDRKFKKDELYLQFNYKTSRAMSPEGCAVDAVVILENIERSKASKGYQLR